MKNQSLKLRILLALALIVTITSSLYGGSVILIKSQLEAIIFENMVADQMDSLIKQLDSQTYDPERLFVGWKFYFADETTMLPAEITSLGRGSHHSVLVGDSFYQIEVGEWDGRPAYLTYDISDWEGQEHLVLQMLSFGMFLVLAVAILMGVSATRAILAPVRDLSIRLTEILPGERNLRIAKDYTNSEIGEIANAFDNYMERLDQFVDRERSFTAAASHELRTPLSVIMGAVDVLAANKQAAPAMRAIERIKRACSEMLTFIEATLYLSREDAIQIYQESPADVVNVVERLLEDNASKLENRDIHIKKYFISNPKLNLPESILQITISNILRNAIEHTNAGSITIEVGDDGITISDTGEGIEEDKLPMVYDRSYSTKAGGTGLGLNLVRRICDRFDWQIGITSTTGVGTSVSISF